MNIGNNLSLLTAHLFRENSGKMVAVLTRMFGVSKIDFILDVVQDAFEQALLKWRFGGIPENPSAWLMKVAKNKALTSLKREKKSLSFSSSYSMEHFEAIFEVDYDKFLSNEEIADSELRLLLSCCHPSISTKNQVILTLKIVCGFGVTEISQALLQKEEAVKKALTRVRALLKETVDILQTPPPTTLSEKQLATVHTILYLMFNEGYKTTRQQNALDHELCYEAIRLAKLLGDSKLDSGTRTSALLSLMFFNLSRFPARLNAEGEWLSLEEQDRNLWDKVFIEEGFYYLERATQGNDLSSYHLEAIIASLHCSAASFQATDWKKIIYLYQQLELVQPASPYVTLNRIIAESYLSLSSGLEALTKLETHSHLKTNFLLPATKGDFYRRKGNMQLALQAYKQAWNLAKSPADKGFMKRRICECQLGQ